MLPLVDAFFSPPVENQRGGGGITSQSILEDSCKIIQFRLATDIKPAAVISKHLFECRLILLFISGFVTRPDRLRCQMSGEEKKI